MFIYTNHTEGSSQFCSVYNYCTIGKGKQPVQQWLITNPIGNKQIVDYLIRFCFWFFLNLLKLNNHFYTSERIIESNSAIFRQIVDIRNNWYTGIFQFIILRHFYS